MKNLNENHKRAVFESMGIYDLRNYGRNKGVKSVTTKKRDEIIDCIIKIEKGELKPHNNFTIGKGRPPMANSSLEIDLTAKQLEEENKRLKGILNRISNIINEYKQ